jgi:hypothetical protein
MKLYRVIRREYALSEFGDMYVVQMAPGPGVDSWTDIEAYHTKKDAFILMERINDLGDLTKDTVIYE